MQKDNCTTKCISTVIMLWEKQYTMGRSMPKPGRLFSFSSSWNMNKPLFHRLFQIHFLELPEYRLPRFLSFPRFIMVLKIDASPVVFKRGLFPLSIHPEQISAQITQREGRCWNQVGYYLTGGVQILSYVLDASQPTTRPPLCHTPCVNFISLSLMLMLASQLYPIFFRSVHNVYCACWIHALLLNADRL